MRTQHSRRPSFIREFPISRNGISLLSWINQMSDYSRLSWVQIIEERQGKYLWRHIVMTEKKMMLRANTVSKWLKQLCVDIKKAVFLHNVMLILTRSCTFTFSCRSPLHWNVVRALAWVLLLSSFSSLAHAAYCAPVSPASVTIAPKQRHYQPTLFLSPQSL